jgi:hypothetical protein|tara:strand:- start:47 stop:196 length:150 start_codon:yes stop_codon:yes gene_type:complete
MEKEKWNWSLSVGFYPGILFGCRAYEEQNQLTYVLYIPFMDLALTMPYN